MINMLTIDVEDWFQVHNLSQVIPYHRWDLLELRVKTNTNLHRTTTRFDHLLGDFDFGSIQQTLVLTHEPARTSGFAFPALAGCASN